MDFNNTNWNLYKPFTVVYETKNLHRASEILGISRAAVSKNMKELSSQLGVTLFNSNQKGVIPTGEATNLYDNIKKAVALIVDAENDFQDFTSETKAKLKIGVTSATAELVVSNYMTNFVKDFPNIEVEFSKQDNMKKLETGKLDLLITLDNYYTDNEFICKDLMNANLIFIASKEFLKKNRLNQTMKLNELLKHQIIMYEESWAPFAKDNIIEMTPRLIKTQSSEMNYHMAKRGIGIALYCKELIEPNDPYITPIHIENTITPQASKIIYLYNKTLSRPAKAFIEGLMLNLSPA